jgi:hypothetical protein
MQIAIVQNVVDVCMYAVQHWGVGGSDGDIQMPMR